MDKESLSQNASCSLGDVNNRQKRNNDSSSNREDDEVKIRKKKDKDSSSKNILLSKGWKQLEENKSRQQ